MGIPCLMFFSFFWLCHAACGILDPQPGIEPMPLALEARSLSHWTAREVPMFSFLVATVYKVEKDTGGIRFSNILYRAQYI